MNNPIHAWAMAYYDSGWCIVPCKNKRPIVDWKLYQKERPSRDIIHDWFFDAPPDAQIGLVTGFISKVTVIDVDTHAEACSVKNEGVCDCVSESTVEIASKIGMTMTSVTGSGGRHLFCNYVPGLKNSAKRLHPQIDIRNEGGIIILPPSKHANGNLYAWDSIMPFNEANKKSLMDFPELWISKYREKNKTDWNEIIKHGVGSGSRNATLASVIGKLVPAFGREYIDAVWELAYLWNQKNRPPVSDQEFETTFQSIVNKHYGK